MGSGPHREERHSPLAVSMLEPALLILLREKPRHGYTLLVDLETLEMASIHPSVVYRTLREMEELEWIRSDWETDQTQGPPRRIYQLTPQGDEVLENWRHELGKTRDLISQLLDRLSKIERR
jgi:PadR family transcriptional regulator PadR